MKLSICMIVKNEEELLPGCLESIDGVGDGIILVDTGSEDDTAHIAEEFGCKVFHHPWQDSFSEARNFADVQAAGEWRMCIDADERLERADARMIYKAMEIENVNAVAFRMLNQMPCGVLQHWLDRMWRDGEAHFEGIKHNQLVFEGERAFVPIRVYHLGYNLSPEKMHKKNERDEILLKKQVAEDKTNAFAWSGLMRLYRCQELWGQAIDTYNEFDMMVLSDMAQHTPLSFQKMKLDMLCALTAEKRYIEAEMIGRELISHYPQNPDTYFHMGALCRKKVEDEKAIQYFQQYLVVIRFIKSRNVASSIPIETWGSEAQAINDIGFCLCRQGRYVQALSAFENAVNADPETEQYKNNYNVILNNLVSTGGERGAENVNAEKPQ